MVHPISRMAKYKMRQRGPLPPPRKQQPSLLLYLLYSILIYALLSIILIIPPIATHRTSRKQLSGAAYFAPDTPTLINPKGTNNRRTFNQNAMTTRHYNLTELEMRLKNFTRSECSDIQNNSNSNNNNNNMTATPIATNYVHNLLNHVPRHGCSLEHAQSSDPHRFIQGRPYCRLENVMIQHDRIFSKRLGGEFLEDSLGQDENLEELQYQTGAFVVHKPLLLPDDSTSTTTNESRSKMYYIQNVLNAVSIQQESSVCTQRLPGVTLLLQRYEYANFYHVLMDWWNAWVMATSSSLVGGIDHVKQVIWLDAHPASSLLDDAWETLFGANIHRMQWLPYGAGANNNNNNNNNTTSHQQISKRHNATCLESAILVPTGYTSELYQLPTGNRFQSCIDSKQMDMFVKWVLSRHGLEQMHKVSGRIVLIDRQPYRSHPRATLKADSRILDNLQAIGQQIQNELSQKLFPSMNFTVQVVQFHQLTFREQLQVVRQAEVLIGNHGAGLTHLVFMDDDTNVLEFLSHKGGLFLQLADWKPSVHYQGLPSVRHHISDEYLQEHLLPALKRIYEDNDDTTTTTSMTGMTKEEGSTKTVSES